MHIYIIRPAVRINSALPAVVLACIVLSWYIIIRLKSFVSDDFVHKSEAGGGLE
jgi:hypothetical protein